MYSKLFLLATVFLIAAPASNAQINVTEGYFPGADGVKLFYRKLGSGPQTVVFLHGGPGLGIGDGGSEMEVLARDRVLLMYDQRGSKSFVKSHQRLAIVLTAPFVLTGVNRNARRSPSRKP
jgi:hypothetical protein